MICPKPRHFSVTVGIWTRLGWVSLPLLSVLPLHWGPCGYPHRPSRPPHWVQAFPFPQMRSLSHSCWEWLEKEGLGTGKPRGTKERSKAAQNSGSSSCGGDEGAEGPCRGLWTPTHVSGGCPGEGAMGWALWPGGRKWGWSPPVLIMDENVGQACWKIAEYLST